MTTPKKVLGFFQLVMINVIAVDSIRSLPFSAVYGFSLLFFYLLAALTFFIPSALVAAELGTGWPTTGGIYVWVREAFGKKWSFFTIWLSWVYNLFWYPTIMALIAGTFTYFFDPALANSKLYMCVAAVLLFWLITLINCFGMRVSSLFSTIGALLGTLFPMALITFLAILWIWQDKAMHIDLSAKSFFPSSLNIHNIAFLTSIFFGLLGLEMAATHAQEVHQPEKNYPRALFVSSFIILGTMILSSLAIALVIPNRELSLATGTMQAFAIFTSAFDLPWLLPLIAACIILGGLGGAGAWIIGPTKGLMVASRDGSIPAFLMRTNKHGSPVRLLALQAAIVTLLCLFFILMPTVNSSFWILSTITAQLALIVYIFLFASALALHHRKSEVKRAFKIPGGKWGIWITSSLGITSCSAVILCGFLPPAQIPITSLLSYELTLIGGMLLLSLLPFLILRKRAGST
jgi:amino acid transporter